MVMHIAVPDADNSVSVNWRTALVNSGLGGITSLPDGDGNNGTISAAEKALIAAGEVLEHVMSARLESGGTSLAQQRTALRAWYAKAKTTVVSDLQTKLRYYGHNESEA